jgi:hypothetical protein
MLNRTQTEAIVKHLRDMANVLENSSKAAVNQTEDAVSAKKRGRKPGAVSDEMRCAHINEKEQRCKNRATKGAVCGKHPLQDAS